MTRKYKGVQVPIDFRKVEAIFGSQENALEMIQLFVEMLVPETHLMEDAYLRNDWPLIKNIAHRIRGSSLYCGAILLEDACLELEHCLLGCNNNKDKIYNKAMTAIVVTEDYVKYCLSSRLA